MGKRSCGFWVRLHNDDDVVFQEGFEHPLRHDRCIQSPKSISASLFPCELEGDIEIRTSPLRAHDPCFRDSPKLPAELLDEQLQDKWVAIAETRVRFQEELGFRNTQATTSRRGG
jgi:hypothetical protein